MITVGFHRPRCKIHRDHEFAAGQPVPYLKPHTTGTERHSGHIGVEGIPMITVDFGGSCIWNPP
jgi:hypothetical protein